MPKNNTSLFLQQMGDTPQTRVLQFFAESRGIDSPLDDVIGDTELSKATVYKIKDSLVRNNQLIKTRTVAGTSLFRINQTNSYVKKIIEIYDLALKDTFNLLKQKHNVFENKNEQDSEEDLADVIIVYSASPSRIRIAKREDGPSTKSTEENISITFQIEGQSFEAA